MVCRITKSETTATGCFGAMQFGEHSWKATQIRQLVNDVVETTEKKVYIGYRLVATPRDRLGWEALLAQASKIYFEDIRQAVPLGQDQASPKISLT